MDPLRVIKIIMNSDSEDSNLNSLDEDFNIPTNNLETENDDDTAAQAALPVQVSTADQDSITAIHLVSSCKTTSSNSM